MQVGRDLQAKGARFVESELEKALYEAGNISGRNVGNFAKVQWDRASRTDQGVHSLSSVSSTVLPSTSGHYQLLKYMLLLLFLLINIYLLL